MNISSFELEHPLGFKINESLNSDELKNITGTKVRNIGDGYSWFDIPPTTISNALVYISICFNQSRLDMITLVVDNSGYAIKGWEGWSEENEHKITRETSAWLSKIGYPPGKYVWGEVWAMYDPKSASGGGGIRFNH